MDLKNVRLVELEQCYNRKVDEFPQTLPSFHPTCYSRHENSFTYDSNLNFVDDSPNPPPQPLMYSYEFCGNDGHYSHDCPPQKFPIYYDDDDDEESFTPLRDIIISKLPLCIVITPFLSTEEPSSDEDLVPIPCESKGIPDNLCDVPFRDNSPPLDVSKDQFKDFSDSELVSLEEVKDFDPEDGEIDTNILLTIKDDILYKKLLNINLLIAKIKSLKDNPTPATDSVLKSPSLFPNSFLEKTDTYDNSLPESEIFCFDIKEKRNVVEDIFDNPTRKPRVHVPNVLPTHPTLYLDSNFTPSEDSLGSDLIVSFPFETRNRIFNPGIFRKVQSKRFLSPNEFSISFIRDPLSPMFDTLLPFSSKNEEKDFNPGSLSLNEATSPLFAYVVWIFLLFLTYPIAPPYLLSSGNKDTIFDLGISIYHSFMPGVSHRSGTFMKFNVYPNHLNESPMEILSSTCFLMDQ
nr:hypothetical protein [Tanacetum cinerariifolium]